LRLPFDKKSICTNLFPGLFVSSDRGWGVLFDGYIMLLSTLVLVMQTISNWMREVVEVEAWHLSVWVYVAERQTGYS